MKINKKEMEKQMLTDDAVSVRQVVNGIKIDGTSFDLSENTLVLRKSNKSVKEKILIDLENVSSTKVRKYSNGLLLFFAVFFLIVGGGAFYPIYIYFDWWGYVSLGAGALIFIVLLPIYLATRNIRITIKLRNGETIKRTCKEVSQFEKINSFFDEMFYKKHK